jgi:hypothetical protein
VATATKQEVLAGNAHMGRTGFATSVSQKAQPTILARPKPKPAHGKKIMRGHCTCGGFFLGCCLLFLFLFFCLIKIKVKNNNIYLYYYMK